MSHVGNTGSKLFLRTASQFSYFSSQKPKKSSDPKKRLEGLLGKLNFEFTGKEENLIVEAYSCPVCKDHSTTCHQIRAVYDAFQLSWAGVYSSAQKPEWDANEGLERQELSIEDLDATCRKTEIGADFREHLYRNLRKLSRVHGTSTHFNAQEFMVSFAQTLLDCPSDKRETYNRSLGRMFGIEKTQQRFRLRKFWLAFLGDNMAMMTHPICVAQNILGIRGRRSLFQILSDATWLPLPYRKFRDFQHYLIKLWLPTLISTIVYLTYIESMQRVALIEVIGPFILYWLIGFIVATNSGFEHRGHVLRRKYILTGESKSEDFRATFAFRAHTPEGHAVERIGIIADHLCGKAFKRFSVSLSKAIGFLHFLVPMLNRIYSDVFGDWRRTLLSDERTLMDVQVWREILSRVWLWMFGGDLWIHVIVTGPPALISGYLMYRLLFITFDIFYNDLGFLYKLKLLRASTISGAYLTYRRKWMLARNISGDESVRDQDFMQFLSLQDEQDLIQWCLIRQLLIDSCAGFKNTQRDVVFAYMFLALVVLSFLIVLKHYDWWFGAATISRPISVLDLWTLLDCGIFSITLTSIMYLKLALYDLRRSDIRLLQSEFYRASLLKRVSGNHDDSETRPADSFSRTASGNSNCPSCPELIPHDALEPSFASFSSVVPIMGSDYFSGGLSGVHSAFGSAFYSERSLTRGRMGRRSQKFGTSSLSVPWPGPETGRSPGSTELQILLEQTARYIQQFDRPPTLLGYPFTWEVLRYMSLSLVAAIITGLKGTIFRKLTLS